MQAEVKNPRWRLTNREHSYLNLYTMLMYNSNRYTNVL